MCIRDRIGGIVRALDVTDPESIAAFVAGIAFYAIGAWPVMGFFGLDVAIVYVAFKINYRAGRAHELVELTSDALSITHVAHNGRRRTFTCNPYWARVNVQTAPDGRSNLSIRTKGKFHSFGHVLNHDERREFAQVLENALIAGRNGPRRRARGIPASGRGVRRRTGPAQQWATQMQWDRRAAAGSGR